MSPAQAPEQGAGPYGGARSFGARFVTRAIGKVFAGRPLTDQERHALRWANDVQRGGLIWRWAAPEQREMIERRLGRSHGGSTYVPADALGRVDPAEWARRRTERRPAPRRTPERALGRARGAHRRARASRPPPDGDGDPGPDDDPDDALRRNGVERRRGDLRPAHELVAAFLARLAEAVVR